MGLFSRFFNQKVRFGVGYGVPQPLRSTIVSNLTSENEWCTLKTTVCVIIHTIRDGGSDRYTCMVPRNTSPRKVVSVHQA